VLKFADDTKVFGRVNSDKDKEVLQQDLHRLMNWSDRWQMPFNMLASVKLCTLVMVIANLAIS